jgi:hypothetical protein
MMDSTGIMNSAISDFSRLLRRFDRLPAGFASGRGYGDGNGEGLFVVGLLRCEIVG